MEALDQVKKVAEANAIIAAGERELARKIKILAKSESKRAKARRDLTKKELDLIKIRLEAAETNKTLVDKKLNFRQGGIIQFNEEELKEFLTKFEQDYLNNNCFDNKSVRVLHSHLISRFLRFNSLHSLIVLFL